MTRSVKFIIQKNIFLLFEAHRQNLTVIEMQSYRNVIHGNAFEIVICTYQKREGQ